MYQAPSSFADPLKDYGFDPSSIGSPEHISSKDPSVGLINVLKQLDGGLNLFPSDPFEGRSTPGSCTSRRCLDWLQDFSNRNSDELDVYDYVEPEELLDGMPLSNRLEFYIYGHKDSILSDIDAAGSWELPESHPLKPSLRCPGHRDFFVNTNWYERLQWAYRCALPKEKGKSSLYILGTDEEHELLLEIGRFRNACSYGGTRLIVSLLHSGADSYPSGYLDTTDSRLSYAQSFYAKKFPNDRQFVQDGIVYTFIRGNIATKGRVPYTVAKKVYSNDNKGKEAICNASYNKGSYGPLAFPTQCIVDYMGLRVVAEPLVPVSDCAPYSLIDELLRECNRPSGNKVMDLTYCLFSSPQLSNCLRHISTYMNLSSWPIPLEASDVSNMLAEGGTADIQRCDGTLHVRNTHEVLPPILESDIVADTLFSLRFRPEFCYNYKKLLKCTLKSEMIFTEEDDSEIFKEALQHMQIVLEDCLASFNGLLDSWDISQAFHFYGVNIRYLGMAYEKTVYAGLKNLLATEMVARAVKHLWDLKLEDFISGKLHGNEAVMRAFLHLINDVFGLYADSSNFWSQSIIPEIARYFNLVKLEGISYRVLPHVMLKSALEYHLGIILPPPQGGKSYRTAITAKDFKQVKMHALLGKNIDHSVSSRSAPSYRDYKPVLMAVFPKSQVAYPSREISIYKVASKLCNRGSRRSIEEVALFTNPIEQGICSHIKAKLIGIGYPCDPACVYNQNLACANHKQKLTGMNLLCLYDGLLQTDVIRRMKMLIHMGYEYLSHRHFEEALLCAQCVMERGPPLWQKLLEARMLELQCYCMMGDTAKCEQLYESLREDIGKVEGHGGLLTLQLSVIVSIEAWMRQNYSVCATHSDRAIDASVIIAGLPQYEWLPVAMGSILGQCHERLGQNLEAIKTQREAVRLCNVSQLPRYTLCHLTRLFVEYLLRNDFYTEGCPLSMELVPIMEKEFGSLSLECLRCIYVSAWSNHQVGCAHFIHPLMFLSNTDRIVNYEWGVDRIKGSVMLEELVNASSCYVRLRHSNNALSLYNSLYERLWMVSSQLRKDLTTYTRAAYPGMDFSKLETEEFLNKDAVLKLLGNNASDDTVLVGIFEELNICRSHILLVIKNILSLRVLSLSSQQCMLLAYKLYNAYVNAVSRYQEGNNAIGPGNAIHIPGVEGHKPVSMYGNSLERHSEKFEASVCVDEKQVPHRGHELRFIEELLMKAPASSETALCERCLIDWIGTDSTSDWFELLFGLGTSNSSSKCDNAFGLVIDILRNLLTPSKRLIILSHVANISKQDIDSTVTFKELRQKLAEVMTPQ